MDPVRLNRYLAQYGVCSRREADRLIAQERVMINERTAVLGDIVNAVDKITVDGNPLERPDEHLYIKLHKPPGITCTTAEDDPDNVVRFLDIARRIIPVGRLDKYSSGLLLLTSDTSLVERMLRPAYGHEREYMVRLEHPFDARFMESMAGGVDIDGHATLPAVVRRYGPNTFSIILKEGRNRQIRKMCEALGKRVMTLSRVRVLHIQLGSLKVGEWAELSADELRELKRRLGL